jgi:prepilin-type N-terminal cleavage/methylation domain-containing protein
VTRRREGGFTLIELMVALTLVAILLGILMRVSIVILGGLNEQREAVELERNARAVIDAVTRAARNASAGVITGDLRDASACNGGLAIAIVNDDDGPDRLDVMAGAGELVTSLRAPLATGDVTMTVADGSGFAAGDVAIVADGTTGRLLPVTGVSGANLGTRTSACATVPLPASGFAAGAIVVRGRYSRFAIEVGVAGVPDLTLDPDGDGPLPSELLAESIEDLQVAVGVDVNGDGTLDDRGTTDDEWFYNAVGDPAPPAITGRRWRALRVTVVARDRKPRGGSSRPAVEDRAAGTADLHRRRTLSTEIQIRNLGSTL